MCSRECTPKRGGIQGWNSVTNSVFWVVATRGQQKVPEALNPKPANTPSAARGTHLHIRAMVWEGKRRESRRSQRSQSVTPGHSHAPRAGPPDICWLKGTLIGINSSVSMTRSFYKNMATDWQYEN
jgi:hypothetical protein